ncbi:MAG TPA: ABC transporter permease [Opitutaceae bacterium]|nr:ABC transporter permease [Opitutaceae bacterium]
MAYELTESFRIAFEQLRVHKLRSVLTALGVIIGIVAVTLMGTAIRGIDIGFENSMAMLGNDILYVQKWPWFNVEDWWNYSNRPAVLTRLSEPLNRIIASTPNSELEVAVPIAGMSMTVKAGGNQLGGVQVGGTSADFGRIMVADFETGRLFTAAEADAGRAVCVLGYDVAHNLFPGRSALDQTVQLQGGHNFTVIGILARQGDFLGLISFDNQALIPLRAYNKFYGWRRGGELQVKVKDKTRMPQAIDELTGDMRRVRGQLPGERDNFSINQQDAFREELAPIRRGIALGGLFVTGLALFVGAIGIMNITFVSVKERTKEIGTRKALGARRRTILLQFLIEAVSICLVGGAIGLVLTFGVCLAVGRMMPSLPFQLSPGLVLIGLAVSVFTGVFAGFAPALGASRLDPVEALRYE